MKLIPIFASLVGLAAFAGAAQGANPMLIMETSHGTIKIELFEDKAPITVKNFLSYVDDKFYDGTIFHRVISNFMIQGGGFDEKFQKKDTKDPIKNEAGNNLSNKRGTLAMARLPDPDSATAQFYINVKDNSNLDRSGGSAGYAVFGKVVEGMDVVDKIKQVATGNKQGHQDVPQENVVIKSIRRAKE